MTEYPPVTIVMTTWFADEQRKKIAEETLASWDKFITYRGDLRLHIADDGSSVDWQPEVAWNGRCTYSRQERRGVGASLNAGFKKAFEKSPLVLYMVDDWQLTQPLDITSWCKALSNNTWMGMIRLGPPHPFLRGKVVQVTDDWQGWALKLERYGFVVAQRPALWHKRMIDYYGWFEEGQSALEVERLYNINFVEHATGPDVYLALPHAFYHVPHSIVPSLSEMEPV